MPALETSEITGTGSLEPRFETLSEAWTDLVSRRTEEPVVRYFDASLTAKSIDALVARVASHWHQAGIGYGDRVVVQLQNVPQFPIACLAAWHLGAAVVPVSPMYRAREIRKIAQDSGARAWVTTPDIWARDGRASAEETRITQVLLTELEDLGQGVPERFRGAEAAPEADTSGEHPRVTRFCELPEVAATTDCPSPATATDVAVLTYTSGTTGVPKGARTTHANMLWMGRAYTEFSGVSGPEHIVMATAPFVHITGMAMHLGAWLSEGSTLVVSYRFHPKVHVEQMSRQRATWTTGTATAYIAMLEAMEGQHYDFSALSFLGCGGAPVPTTVADRIKDAFGVNLGAGYGLTEVSGAATSTRPGTASAVDPSSGIISVGEPLFTTSIRIVDLDGRVLPVGEPGEVLIQGPGVVDGYWENPEATADSFVDAWLHTGDVGFLDSDGLLYIVDRTKNMIVVSGYKVWPREVEDVLYSHPMVKEVAVVGGKDEYRGETVVAVVSVNAQGQALGQEELAGVLEAHCREHLAAYKVPRKYVLKEELPKNFNGKIQHMQLRQEVGS